MSDIIHLLPDHIANQIAAGEVIQRPASVVKELMENSVDAGAKNVTVVIKDAGRTLVQVIDDGKGMSETDARMAFERHATSKISSVDDLFSLHTMGFRGEALASIAAVAQVELRTRTKGSETGIFISIAGSTVEDVSPGACQEGSVFSVKNLFYNVPARRKFLKSSETEFRHILTEFERIALVHLHVSFVLKHNDATIYDLPAGALKQRIVDIFGKSMNKKLLPVDTATSIVNITGFTGALDSVKKHSCKQYFFVNGRYMRHPYFHKAVAQAYEKMVPAGEMPDYMIYFTLDPATIDVNIHPTKTEIKFENEKPVWQILHSVVREALGKSNSIPSIDFDSRGLIDIPVYNPQKVEAGEYRPPTIEVNSDYNPFREARQKHPTDDWKSLYEGFFSEKQESSCTVPGIQAPCFQYKNKYIITSLKSGLVIIDQHRAHVCILYDRFLKQVKAHNPSSQKFLFPETVELTAAEMSVLSVVKEDLKALGFDIVCEDENTCILNASPTDVSASGIAATVKDLLSAAADSDIPAANERQEKIALSLAKSAAMKAGKTLSSEEMELMIASLFSLENHGITPEGNPVLTIVTDEELTKRI